jgi:hypothetical protein
VVDVFREPYTEREIMELYGSVTEKEKSFVETWENVAEATNYIIREDRRGDEAPDGISGRRRFKLTTYERMLTEDKIIDVRLNPFKNGSFRPVVVPDDITIETNPNALSDEDIARLFVSSANAWDAYMEVIDAPATLKRMLDLAEHTDMSLARFRQLEQMYQQHSNVGKRITQKDQEEFDKMGPTGQSKPVPGDSAPKTPTRIRRSA